MRPGEFAEQAMGAQQAELACDASRLAAAFHVIRGLAVQGLAEVTIAETGQGVFTANHSGEQLGVRRGKGIQSPATPAAMILDGAAELVRQAAQRRFGGHGGERFQVSPVGRVGELSPAGHVGHRLAQT